MLSMAIYDMRCKECGEHFNLFCSWAEMKTSKCPKCGSADVAQVYSGVAVLKGSGGTRSASSSSRKFG